MLVPVLYPFQFVMIALNQPFMHVQYCAHYFFKIIITANVKVTIPVVLVVQLGQVEQLESI